MRVALQFGAGALACALCGGASCLCNQAMMFPAAAFAFLVGPVGLWSIPAMWLTLSAATGASVGLVETVVGNILGNEEIDWVWPVTAGAASGALVGVAQSASFVFGVFVLPSVASGPGSFWGMCGIPALIILPVIVALAVPVVALLAYHFLGQPADTALPWAARAPDGTAVATTGHPRSAARDDQAMAY